MFKIQKYNNISQEKLNTMPNDLYEIGENFDNPDGILLRSFNLLNAELPQSLKAIARAGAGVNNIPIDKCSENGIVVFNTPGANANGVKELVLASLFLSSRKIYRGINWTKSLKGKGEDVVKLVEKSKSQFQGPEIKGKKLGIIGLGAIGAAVANDALALGMEVIGYDPYISVDSAWNLSRKVEKETNFDNLLAEADYITIHVPLNNNTKGMINKEKFAIMKKGMKIINIARGGLVVNKDLLEAIEDGTVSCYVTDFPEDELIGNDNIITIPHLGASTPESEENCAAMAVEELRNFLERGTIKNSVNFPNCDLEYKGHIRLLVGNINVPNMVGQVTTILAQNEINIASLLNSHKGKIAYNIIDVDGNVTSEVLEKIKAIDGVVMVRIIR
ncbi:MULTISPECIES: phosphoglycerate dehydrogenase [Clostridium]|uniref:D-3-phosphoglycerate dehydrogenase n=3 Tax=Clostridium TaxID=1485 RepID=D8GQ18_CLOLD|nr:MULTISPECIES: phosphoglycerate dehydrogenase [Clostridium]ADK16109.1 predicted D-isomer specific 2-hydroxyacid dehydrogenase [Clostridium ljungdahlii DSM 13528]AGY75290.1 phosphoglycerate dehydrogenase [Clostridium autoethanogenum DSM 10061]ALU35456.1 3-Phosphoglycerate dehydrogenase [Clostridium autoethanogenum DSM 10061]OAA84193.1 D-3-phosphoglycerate dehydrogenase [Clostridium ljungdahlii DSM 13528]OAA89381.1 D-3-phosphoglycerate dehydrogenase [Clostridium coskatii]